MDNQDKQTEKISKGLKIYLNIYSAFLYFSSFFCVAIFLSKIDFLDGWPFTIITFVFFAVHVYSYNLVLLYGKEELLVDENEKKRKYF